MSDRHQTLGRLMDDLAFGRVVRLARLRRPLTQQELAERAGTSRPVISRIEHGHLGDISLDVLRRVAAVLEIRVELVARSRALDLDRIVNGRHAALAEHLVTWVTSFMGWAPRPEVSFAEYGERGVIDLLCWHAATRALLIVEIKTELLDFGELLGKLDVKERLAPRVARRFDWRPVTVSVCLLVADSNTNRRRAAAHGSLLGAALPQDGRALTRWLRAPTGSIRALRFVPDVRTGNVRGGFAAPTRVRTRRPARPAT